MKPSSCSSASCLEDFRREEEVVVESARDLGVEVSSSSVRLLSDRDDTSDPFLDLSDFDLGIFVCVVTQDSLRPSRNPFAFSSNAISRSREGRKVDWLMIMSVRMGTR